ncbi:hypothetical protein MPTK1_7g17860 [Marchantia polymorpha subsp. ruderalis]|uniref:Uncharacterized protein n=2 Tax=Marchantia polymorpha TaxID=3197 RepID=A0AAF6C0W6_MARPO|nr:hypothetical protein MARPO_0102s0054 [Marchantia polymorpha]BBN17900.1 hypothetical protein Mp_7g17860 [Marchantia polymorpha subsp. ruderalis]|eukprot:PTQ32190.1 hypothetical protein MARPO_0102s0054 [Marchantia polymorpha]
MRSERKGQEHLVMVLYLGGVAGSPIIELLNRFVLRTHPTFNTQHSAESLRADLIRSRRACLMGTSDRCSPVLLEAQRSA